MIEENLNKIIKYKIELLIITKFKSLEEYDNKLLKDLTKKQDEHLNKLYQKSLIYNIPINLDKIDIVNKDIVELLKSIISIEKETIKKCNNFGLRQSIIHCLADDETFLYYLR
ncbi:hypothetical protein ACPB8Q_00250 [Methanocaldococcus indicus]|uniref:hypothetical protein n=1 Tax=Methanocaldococcus indicus TaxID=213231 RepID=UPI003C6D8C2E